LDNFNSTLQNPRLQPNLHHSFLYQIASLSFEPCIIWIAVCHSLSYRYPRLKKLWQKTGDVEKLRKRGGRPKSLDEYLEQAIVQIFLENVDITMEEALNWLQEEFDRRVCR